MDNIIILCHIAEFQTRRRRLSKEKTQVMKDKIGRFVRGVGLDRVLHTESTTEPVSLFQVTTAVGNRLCFQHVKKFRCPITHRPIKALHT